MASRLETASRVSSILLWIIVLWFVWENLPYFYEYVLAPPISYILHKLGVKLATSYETLPGPIHDTPSYDPIASKHKAPQEKPIVYYIPSLRRKESSIVSVDQPAVRMQNQTPNGVASHKVSLLADEKHTPSGLQKLIYGAFFWLSMAVIGAMLLLLLPDIEYKKGSHYTVSKLRDVVQVCYHYRHSISGKLSQSSHKFGTILSEGFRYILSTIGMAFQSSYEYGIMSTMSMFPTMVGEHRILSAIGTTVILLPLVARNISPYLPIFRIMFRFLYDKITISRLSKLAPIIRRNLLPFTHNTILTVFLSYHESITSTLYRYCISPPLSLLTRGCTHGLSVLRRRKPITYFYILYNHIPLYVEQAPALVEVILQGPERLVLTLARYGYTLLPGYFRGFSQVGSLETYSRSLVGYVVSFVSDLPTTTFIMIVLFKLGIRHGLSYMPRGHGEVSKVSADLLGSTLVTPLMLLYLVYHYVTYSEFSMPSLQDGYVWFIASGLEDLAMFSVALYLFVVDAYLDYVTTVEKYTAFDDVEKRLRDRNDPLRRSQRLASGLSRALHAAARFVFRRVRRYIPFTPARNRRLRPRLKQRWGGM